MGTVQGPVICRPAVRVKQSGVLKPLVNNFMTAKGGLFTSGFRGSKGKCRVTVRLGYPFSQLPERKNKCIRCTFSSSTGSGGTAENFNESEEDYVNSSVIEAVEVKSGSDGFCIKMCDGEYLRCVHNNPQVGDKYYAPDPAIVLKMEDGSGLLLPIIVPSPPSKLLMDAVLNVKIARPTVYQVVKQMIDKMGYQAQLVRVTKRVGDTYFARLYLTKVGNDEQISFDLRPSDAINLAVRCNVPIQVNKQLVYCDGMKVVEPSKVTVHATLSEGLLFAGLDRPNDQPCVESIEFDLVRNMLIAAVEERYRDAAQWRDKLTQLRAKRRNWA